MFDAPYLLTMGAQNGGWVRYQLLPAYMHGHRVNIVYYDIEVNPDGSRVKYPSEFYHCIHCGLMGSEETMQNYTCYYEVEDAEEKETGVRHERSSLSQEKVPDFGKAIGRRDTQADRL